MNEQNTDVKSLAHTKWNCKYHVVFAPKYRRKVFYNEKREDIREIIRTLCQWKGVEIIEGEVCLEQIYLLLSISPKMSVSSFMRYLKGKFPTAHNFDKREGVFDNVWVCAVLYNNPSFMSEWEYKVVISTTRRGNN